MVYFQTVGFNRLSLLARDFNPWRALNAKLMYPIKTDRGDLARLVITFVLAIVFTKWYHNRIDKIALFAKNKPMYQVTSEYAKNNFNEVIERAANEPGGVVIVRENQNFILISQEELEAWVETAKLLEDPDLLTDIATAREEYQKGEVLTIEQVFE